MLRVTWNCENTEEWWKICSERTASGCCVWATAKHTQRLKKTQRSMESIFVTDCVCVYPAGDWMQHRRQNVVLKLEELRWFTVHSETVGVIIKLHRTHKTTVTCHHVGQLEIQDGLIYNYCHYLWKRKLPVRQQRMTISLTLLHSAYVYLDFISSLHHNGFLTLLTKWECVTFIDCWFYEMYKV